MSVSAVTTDINTFKKLLKTNYDHALLFFKNAIFIEDVEIIKLMLTVGPEISKLINNNLSIIITSENIELIKLILSSGYCNFDSVSNVFHDVFKCNDYNTRIQILVDLNI